MRVLIACEFSGVVRRAFRGRGHDAWSCDLLPAEDSSPFHLQEDALLVAKRGCGYRFETESWQPWDLMIAHPPCTYLTRAGWHWVNKPDSAVLPLKGAPRRRAAVEAADFFRALLDAPIARICIENPLPIVHVGLPKPDQTIQPWEFGHGERKATCFWLKGLPPLRATDIVEGRTARVHRASPGPDRWKERSRTKLGIADAMAAQWGSLEEDSAWLNTHQASA